MLHLLDESLEAFLRAAVPLPKREVDVSFAAPDRDWAARVSRPTVNLYLWDVRRNLDQRDGGMETVVGDDGRPQRRPPLPRVDCRYLVTAWTSAVQGGGAAEEGGRGVVPWRGSGGGGGTGAFLVPAEPGDEISIDGVRRGRVPESGPIDLPEP